MPDSFENLLGPNNISTLIAANNLADIYCSEGEMLVARHLYGRALTGYKKVLGPDHKSALMIADNLANLFKAQAKLSSTETISSPGQTVSRKTKKGPVSGRRSFRVFTAWERFLMADKIYLDGGYAAEMGING